ncbi:calcium-binding protein [Aestuariibius sp. HNIBRBA575]|uniref:calcium-binding protein n=1 Tax=Aestuariibius sp. HNIBRBA575 TaxID=3233343 RepID=UPI0034A3170D
MYSSVRDHLNAFVSLDLSTIPGDDVASLAALSGVAIDPNNFFDNGIDVHAFVTDIEIVAYQIDAFFEATTDIEALESYLQANDPSYYDSFMSQTASIQTQIDTVFDDATPGYRDYWSAEFAILWEATSGVSTAFYSAITTTAGGLDAIFRGATDEIDNLTNVFFDEVASNLGVSLVQVAAVSQFCFVVSDKMTSIGSRLADAFANPDATTFASTSVGMLQDINAILASYDSVETIMTGVPVTGRVQAVFDLVSELTTVVTIITEQLALADTVDDPNLTDLSRRFLDDAITMNALEITDVVANLITITQDLFNIGGSSAGMLAYFTEGARTLVDIVSLGQSTPWQIEAAQFAQYDNLASIAASYQTLLSNALDHADTLDGGTWGTGLTSVIPVAPIAALSVLSDRYDHLGDAAIEEGGTLAVGGSISGDIGILDNGDWFEVSLTSGQDYRFSVLEGTIANGDIRLYDAQGRLVAHENAALSDASNHIIEGTALETGTYYVIFESTLGGTYTINFDAVTLPVDLQELRDAPRSTDTPYTLSVGESFRGNMNNEDLDHQTGDWIRVELVAGTDYRFQLTEGTIINGDIRLYDSLGQLVANENAALTDSSEWVIEGTALTTGTYFVAVEGTYSGSYTIEFDAVTLPVDLQELRDAPRSTDTPYTLSVGESFRGNMNNEDLDHQTGDWIRVELVAGTDYRFQLTEGTIINGDIRLYDSLGQLVANENAALTDSSEWVIEGTALTTGTYFVAVEGTYSGSYTIEFDAVTLPDDLTELRDAPRSTDTPYTLSVGESFRGNMNNEDLDHQTGDWIRVELVAGTDYRFQLTEGTIINGDIRLYDSLGQLVANENAALTDSSEWVIEGTALTTGTYFVAVEGTYSGSYTIEFDAVTLPNDVTELTDAQDDITTGYSIAVGQSFGGTLNYADDYNTAGDWIEVSLTAGDTYRFTLTEGTIINGDLALYDSSGMLFATEDIALTDSSNWVIEGTVLTSGTYYVAVENSGYYGSYSIAVETSIATATIHELADATAGTDTMYALDSGETFRGTINLGDDDLDGVTGGDWVEISLVAGQDYRLEVTEDSIYSGDVSLYDSSGTLLAVTDPALSDSSHWVIQGTATTTGTYFIGVTGNVYGSYELAFDITGSVANGGGNSDTMVGTNGDDVVNGLGGADHLTGGAGNDTLSGGAAGDWLYGGDGLDVLNGGNGFDRLYGETGDDQLSGFFGNDSLYGGAGADTLLGQFGSDSLSGGAGNDVLNGGNGNDAMDGGADNDTLIGGRGNDVMNGGAGNDTINGQVGSDDLFGGAGADSISGGAGLDTIEGGNGTDEIDGGLGADSILGGGGADVIHGNAGSDTINGGAAGDQLFGEGGDDDLAGGDGADTLLGGTGNDVLNGGNGSDVLFGGAGVDRFVFAGSIGSNIVSDWQNGVDIIDFSGFAGVSETSHILTLATQSGNDVLLSLGAGQLIRVLNANVSQLDDSDFVF